MKSSASKIQMNSFNGLFGLDNSEQEVDRTQEVLLTELFPFKGHPFQVRDDDAMQKMTESIAEYGVLSPGIVRPRPEGGYEIIAGHRRKRGSELAGRIRNGGQHRGNARKNGETARSGYGADRKGHRQERKGHHQERTADGKDGTAHRKGHRENL